MQTINWRKGREGMQCEEDNNNCQISTKNDANISLSSLDDNNEETIENSANNEEITEIDENSTEMNEKSTKNFQEEVEYISLEGALNRIGFGKYQTYTFVICGLIYATDAMEIMSLSLLQNPVEEEWNLQPWQTAMLSSSVFLGMLIGAITFGRLGDIYGLPLRFFILNYFDFHFIFTILLFTIFLFATFLFYIFFLYIIFIYNFLDYKVRIYILILHFIYLFFKMKRKLNYKKKVEKR